MAVVYLKIFFLFELHCQPILVACTLFNTQYQNGCYSSILVCANIEYNIVSLIFLEVHIKSKLTLFTLNNILNHSPPAIIWCQGGVIKSSPSLYFSDPKICFT